MYSPKTTEFEPAQPDSKSVIDREAMLTKDLTQQHHISSVKSSSKEPGLLEDILQVVLLASVLGNTSTELEVDSHTSSSNDHTRDPKEESKTNATRKLQDTTRSGKDTSADHSVEDQERSAPDADLALVRSCFGMLTFAYTDQSAKE